MAGGIIGCVRMIVVRLRAGEGLRNLTTQRGLGRMGSMKVVKNPKQDKRPWTCLACGQTLSRLDTLKRHMVWEHDASHTAIDVGARTARPSDGEV